MYDEEWPRWYADYVVAHGINDFLGQAVTGEQPSPALETIKEVHEASDKNVGWAAFTADKIVEQFG